MRNDGKTLRAQKMKLLWQANRTAKDELRMRDRVFSIRTEAAAFLKLSQ